MSRIRKQIAGVQVLGALATATSAMAQQATPATQSGPVLEEIVVTADRQDSYSADFVQAGSFRGARQIDTPLGPMTIGATESAVVLCDFSERPMMPAQLAAVGRRIGPCSG